MGARRDSTTSIPWNPDRVGLLRQLHGEGWSCAQIAAKLGGTTRNAVIGKAKRLKLDHGKPSPALSLPTRFEGQKMRAYPEPKPKPPPQPREVSNVTKITEKRHVAHNAVKSARDRANGAPVLRDPTPVRDEALPASARPWEDRAPGHCAWPFTVAGETWSCCRPCPGETYCEEHAERMFVRRAA